MSLAAETSRDAADEPDRLEGFASPREVDSLFGHAEARQEFLAALASGRMHHAWLIVGPEGVGKATLAYDFARTALRGIHAASPDRGAGADPHDAVFRKVAALSHPNLLLLRRSFVDKTKRYSQWIGVDEVRRLRAFLGNTSGESGWRVVIVDRADDLNANAANALLKALEEPPQQTLFLLIANAEGRLPVTIRSRCRTLRVKALGKQDLEAAVLAALARDAHDFDPKTLRVALDLSEGSVRRALELSTGEGIALYREIMAALARLPELDAAGLHRWGDKLAGSSNADRFELFYALLLGVLERLVRIAATQEGGTDEERELAKRLLGDGDLSRWAELWEAIGNAKSEAVELNLDRSLLLFETFARLKQASAR